MQLPSSAFSNATKQALESTFGFLDTGSGIDLCKDRGDSVYHSPEAKPWKDCDAFVLDLGETREI